MHDGNDRDHETAFPKKYGQMAQQAPQLPQDERILILYGAYCASKDGILAMTRALSLEWVKQGIRINAICPGPIQTPLLQAEFDTATNATTEEQSVVQAIPYGRLGTPDQIVRVAVFLASDDAEFIHSTAITVDGGKTAI